MDFGKFREGLAGLNRDPDQPEKSDSEEHRTEDEGSNRSPGSFRADRLKVLSDPSSITAEAPQAPVIEGLPSDFQQRFRSRMSPPSEGSDTSEQEESKHKKAESDTSSTSGKTHGESAKRPSAPVGLAGIRRPGAANRANEKAPEVKQIPSLEESEKSERSTKGSSEASSDAPVRRTALGLAGLRASRIRAESASQGDTKSDTEGAGKRSTLPDFDTAFSDYDDEEADNDNAEELVSRGEISNDELSHLSDDELLSAVLSGGYDEGPAFTEAMKSGLQGNTKDIVEASVVPHDEAETKDTRETEPSQKKIPLPNRAQKVRAKSAVTDAKKAASAKSRGRKKTRERVKRDSKTSVYKPSKRGFESEFGRQGAREFLVDAEGVSYQLLPGKVSSPKGFDDLVKAAEVHGTIAMDENYARSVVAATTDADGNVVDAKSYQGKVIYPWTKPVEATRKVEGEQRRGLMMNEKELDFFRNLDRTREEIVTDPDELRLLRATISGRAAGSQRGRSAAEKSAVARTAVAGDRAYSRKVGIGVKPIDQEIIWFLAKFRYSTARHLGGLRGNTESTITKRLLRLRDRGLVDNIPIWGNSPVWFLTSGGMLMSGMSLPRVNARKLSYMLIPHTFATNHVAAHLIGGNLNVLALDEFPVRNRTDLKGEPKIGETLVSELEIQSSFGRMSNLMKSDEYRPLIMNTIDKSFQEWEDMSGALLGIPSPEMEFGNEYMWVLFPPRAVGLAHHVPDLVVSRIRSMDGKAKSIAVEVELSAKSGSYESTLEAYKADTRLYEKVIWVTNSTNVASSLENTAKKVGLWQEGRIEIVPLLTKNGAFESRDLWTL